MSADAERKGRGGRGEGLGRWLSMGERLALKEDVAALVVLESAQGGNVHVMCNVKCVRNVKCICNVKCKSKNM